MIANQVIDERYALYNGDCIEVMNDLPEASISMALFSPPFADLYVFSDNPRDLGNAKNYDEFFEHFNFVIDGLRHIMMPGRNVVVHCMDLPAMKEKDGFIGLKDFSGDIIRAFIARDFRFHSRHVIWKDPLIEATRTKTLGLLHKQLMKDSNLSRAGIPDQLLAFRAPGENAIPITHTDGLTSYCGSDDPRAGITGIERSHVVWRAYASPVWMDIRQTRTMNAKAAREQDDEKHICPLQLDVIERACVLWSNPGETVFTPFMGVGSEVYGAVINGRRGVGVELKSSYYAQAVKNLAAAKRQEEPDLFSESVG